ncbi:hemerythrin domain-containing protein [Uniformispora flossi]|uniref:hemerythrin domain-containing protein n=1 Tax=Uniformispora flossi TaxID=3390723 RepID=UPI003C2ABDE7
MNHDGDVIHELTADHRDVDHTIEELDAAPPHDPVRKRLVDRLTTELVRLAVAEEQCVLPAVRERAPDGKELVDREMHDLGEIERILAELETHEASDADFDRLVVELEAAVVRQEHDDEDRLFVRLHEAFSAADLETMGDEVRRAMKYARTHPHLQTRDTPPEYDLLSGASIQFVDAVRALFHRRRRPAT